jgi:quercetin dioxygenase-like cupin family protein
MTMRMSAVVLGVFLLGLPTTAQQAHAPRTILQRADTSVGHEAIASVASFAPQSSTGWHTHPGDMVGYIVSGTLTVEIQGRPAFTRRAGESLIVPAGALHRENAADAPAQLFASYFVEKGQPLNGQR